MSEHDLRHIDLGTFIDGVSAIQTERDRLKLDLSAALAKVEELTKDRDDCLDARTHYAELYGEAAAQRDHLAALLRLTKTIDWAGLDLDEWSDRVDAALATACPAAPTSEHSVPHGITSVTRSLGAAIVRFGTSEQLNEFYRAAKSTLPTERSGQIRSTPR